MITDSSDGFSGRDSILDGGRDNLLLDENTVNRARRNNIVDSSSKKSKGKTTKSYIKVTKTRDLGLAYPLRSMFAMANKDNPLSESQFLLSPIDREYSTSDDKINRIKMRHSKELYDKNNQINDLKRDIRRDRYKNEEKQAELENKVNVLSTLLGAGAGGLGGYGLTRLMTKNKWLRALGTFGGGVAGGIIGSKLTPVNEKHASENKIANMNSKYSKNKLIDLLGANQSGIVTERAKGKIYADSYEKLHNYYKKRNNKAAFILPVILGLDIGGLTYTASKNPALSIGVGLAGTGLAAYLAKKFIKNPINSIPDREQLEKEIDEYLFDKVEPTNSLVKEIVKKDLKKTASKNSTATNKNTIDKSLTKLKELNAIGKDYEKNRTEAISKAYYKLHDRIQDNKINSINGFIGALGGLSTGALLDANIPSNKYKPFGVLGGSIAGGLLSYYLAKKLNKKYKVGEEFKQKLDNYVENSLKNEPFAYEIDYDLNYDPNKKGSRPYDFSFDPVE